MDPIKRKLIFVLLYHHIISLSVLFQLQGILFLCSAYIKWQTDVLAIISQKNSTCILRKIKRVIEQGCCVEKIGCVGFELAEQVNGGTT